MGREASNEEIMIFLKIADKNNSGSIDNALKDTFSINEEGKNEVCDSFKILDVNYLYKKKNEQKIL